MRTIYVHLTENECKLVRKAVTRLINNSTDQKERDECIRLKSTMTQAEQSLNKSVFRAVKR